MASKLRKYGWAAKLVLVAALSFIGAWNTNRFVADKIRPPEPVEGLPPPRAGSAPEAARSVSSSGATEATSRSSGGAGQAGTGSSMVVRAPAKPPLRSYRIILTRNIFDSDNPLDFPDMAELGEGEGEGGTAAAKSLSVRLYGTVTTSPPQFSWAIMSKDEANAPQEIFRIGDDVYGEGTLRKVRRKEVVVALEDGTEVVVPLYEGEQSETRVARTSRSSRSEEEQELGSSIRKIGENRYEIDSSEIQLAMNNIDKLAREARIVPSFKDGNTVGFKVFRIKPNSFYKKLGLRNGDVITAINGFEINSTEKALQLYQMLRTEKNLNLEITRRGQPITLEYVIR